MPRHGRFGHPYGTGFQMLPGEAFKDSSGDKPTERVDSYDLYEAWRDIGFFVCVEMSVLGFAWWAKAAGYASTYWTLTGLATVVPFVCFGFWIVATFTSKLLIKSDKVRARYLLIAVSYVLALVLHYSLMQ